jgi:electron transfer flavoprotein beta subunit
VRILVPLKQVADPDHSARIRVSVDGKSIDATALERKTNPFDEYALETSLRLTEDGRSPRERKGEVIAATLGTRDTETMLRSALATGAARAVRIDVGDDVLDGTSTAKVLAKLARAHQVDLVVLGKQTVDGDGNEVAQRLGVLLDWPCATFTATVVEQQDGRLVVEREIDGGIERLIIVPPAIISVDLRIVAPNSVRSRWTPADYEYPPGVRFASLPAILQSKRKPLEVLEFSSLIESTERTLEYVGYTLPNVRTSGKKLGSVDELVACLATEAKVIS